MGSGEGRLGIVLRFTVKINLITYSVTQEGRNYSQVFLKLGEFVWRINERRWKGARKRKKFSYYPKNNGAEWV